MLRLTRNTKQRQEPVSSPMLRPRAVPKTAICDVISFLFANVFFCFVLRNQALVTRRARNNKAAAFRLRRAGGIETERRKLSFKRSFDQGWALVNQCHSTHVGLPCRPILCSGHRRDGVCSGTLGEGMASFWRYTQGTYSNAYRPSDKVQIYAGCDVHPQRLDDQKPCFLAMTRTFDTQCCA